MPILLKHIIAFIGLIASIISIVVYMRDNGNEILAQDNIKQILQQITENSEMLSRLNAINDDSDIDAGSPIKESKLIIHRDIRENEIDISGNDGRFYRININSTLNVVERVVSNNGWTNFTYDIRGNLSKTKSSTGKNYFLIFDRKERLVKAIHFSDTNPKKIRKALKISYNSFNKPNELSIESLGKTMISYNSVGEITKVWSNESNENMLNIVKFYQDVVTLTNHSSINYWINKNSW